MPTERSPGNRLERALELLMQRPPSTAADAERLLAENGDLRDLLEPMLEGSESAHDDDRDQVLGDFRLVRELGRGGMGIVHEAWQRSLDRKVAVKVLSPELVASPGAVARFRREAAAAARLDHPGIVKVYGFGQENGRHFFAMEHVDGEPLSRCRERFREPARAVALLAQVADALVHAHAHGLVHRDVKPDNVLVRSDDAAMLTDFGIARDEVLPSMTQHGGFVGTLDHASPEQVRGETVDARTDVWAIGVMLYELVAGEHPFPAPTSEALAHAILGAEPRSLRGRPGVSDDVAAVIGQALAKQRDRRYASAAALLADLRALASGHHVAARLPTTQERLLRWVRREPWQAIAAVVLVLGLFTTGTGFALASHRADQNAGLAAAESTARSLLADKVHDYDLLAGVVHCDRAVQAEKQLRPAWPGLVPALEAWLRDDWGRLERLRPDVAHGVASLRAQAAGVGVGDAASARNTFADPARQFLHDALVGLLARIDGIEREQLAAVRERLSWAQRVRELTFAHPNARVTWAAARAAIAAADGGVAHTSYANRRIPLDDDQVYGLVPIGMNPVTKLWEFYDLRSAWDGSGDPAALPIPQHDERGSVAVGEATGIVFVLLPGGLALVGAQSKDPAAENYDPDAPGFVGPVQEVELAPFFVARHELTQGQWARLCRGDALRRFPSGFPAGADDYLGRKVTLAHPVERVTWDSAMQVLGEHGMTLPTEAQWEYGCRAGTDTPYWCGKTSAELAGVANVYDVSAIRSPINPEVHEDFDDGFNIHAPVGSFTANAFGLFDVHGNVGEWCLDAPAPNMHGFRDGNGERTRSERPDDRSQRGGSYKQQGRTSRSSMWGLGPKETRAIDLGVRAVRRLGGS